MRTRALTLVLIGSLLPCAAPALGQEAPRPPTATRRAPVLNGLRLKTFDLEVSVADGLATAVVEQVFFNPGGRMAEATWLFPLAQGAAPTGLQLLMEGRYEGGNLLTRGRARRIYDEITRRNRDPALLECIGKGLVRCSVFPVPANDDAGVRFSWRQPVASAGAMRRLVLPLDASRFNHLPVGRVSIEVQLETSGALQAILCPTHDVVVEREGLHRAVVRLNARNAHLAGDLVLLYAEEDAPLGAVVASYRRPGAPGWFVLSLDAAFAREQQRAAPRDVVLAVDTSNSAGRQGVDAAAAAVADAVAALKEHDRYALVAFGAETRVLRGFTHPGPGTATEVREMLSRQPVAGRTRLANAIRGSAALAADGRSGTGIVLLTDGRAAIPGEDPGAAAAEVAARGHRVGVAGVGERLDAVALDTIGDEGRGDAAYPTARAGLEQGVVRLLESTRSVPLTDVTVTVPGATRLEPEEARVLRCGDTLLVAGRYVRGGPVDVHLRGRVAGEWVEHTIPVTLHDDGGDPAVARLWAARHVGRLLDEARRSGDAERYRGRIERLGRRYGIVTPFSSLLVLERGDQKRFLGGMRRRPLLSSDGGSVVAARRETVTRAAPPAAELAARIRRLRRTAHGAVDPFVDLLGENRMRLRHVGGDAFYRDAGGTWVQADLVEREPADPAIVVFLSEEWKALAASDPRVTRICALGSRVLFTTPDGTAVRIVEGEPE